MIEALYKKRKQIKIYDKDRVPERSLIEKLIKTTFETMPSKQSIVPYRVHVLGPEHKDLKIKFYELLKTVPGGVQNFQVVAPYVLFFTPRLATPEFLKRKMYEGHLHTANNPKEYRKAGDVYIEIGMFAKMLTTYCLEQDIDVSYTRCFPDWKEDSEEWKMLPLKDPLILSMSIGYRKPGIKIDYNKEEWKPDLDDVIKWL